MFNVCYLQTNNNYTQDSQFTYNVTVRGVRVTIVAVEKQETSVIQHAKRMRYIVLTSSGLSGSIICFHIVS